MTYCTPTEIELEFKKVFFSNLVSDTCYFLLFTILLYTEFGFTILGFTNLGASQGMVGEMWSWLSSVVPLIVNVGFASSLWLIVLDFLLTLTEGDPERVRWWCRWKVVVAFLMLHTRTRTRFRNLLQQIQQQELEDAMV